MMEYSHLVDDEYSQETDVHRATPLLSWILGWDTQDIAEAPTGHNRCRAPTVSSDAGEVCGPLRSVLSGIGCGAAAHSIHWRLPQSKVREYSAAV